MPLAVQLQEEDGTVVDTLNGEPGVLDRLLPSEDDKTFICLRFVDPWGNTVFNKLQMIPVIEEIDRLLQQPKLTVIEREVLERLRSMATRCSERVHLYIKFIGD